VATRQRTPLHGDVPVFRYDGSDHSFAGIQTGTVDIELSQDGTTLTTSTTTNIFDANGVLIVTRCTAGTGTRAQ
jgi:hypothetical protein